MNKLIRITLSARKKAYAPYSGFKVGAALEAVDGRVFTGCNIENASHGIGICAERVALAKAVSEGARRFKRIAIVTGSREITTPCGACRQALAEFAPNMKVILATVGGRQSTTSLKKLLPRAFTLHKRSSTL